MTPAHPRSERATVSVVMVTHGAWTLAEQAIRALATQTRASFELIVVDNASTDGTREGLSRLDGVRAILNDVNRGFGQATNQGAVEAAGEYLLLLNSDAFVHDGWLAPLLEVLSQPGVGAVVPRYLDRDGRLQEAGALLARDGTVQLYGEGDDPNRGPYRFRRRVQYASAVCMLMRRATFRSLGGFDERYGLAYYEDVDLCMRLAQSGMSVIYEPRSTVTHVRYGSGGLDAAVELSERNRELFVQRWATVLRAGPSSFVKPSDQATIHARDAAATPRFLLCGGASLQTRVAELMEAFSDARLTWAIDGDSLDGDRWRASGVEVLDEADPSWLNARLFHYDVVLRGSEPSSPLLEAVQRTQPQAPQIEADAAGLVAALARAGIALPDRALR